MSDRDNPLLESVDALTKTVRTKVIQDGPIGSGLDGQQTVTIELPPLLEQLDDAIRSSMGGASTSGASLAFEGAVLNTGALFTAMKISSQIRDWCRIVGVTPVKHSGDDLRAWYVATLTRNTGHEVEQARITILNSWAAQIRALLDPPRERDLPDACPVCGAVEWWDPKDGKKYLRPLVIRYRPNTGADMIQQAKAMCRGCETVWGVRELAYAIEHRADDTPSEPRAG